MTRPALARTAACLAAALPIALAGVLLPPTSPADAVRRAPAGTPLEVSLETMTPSAIPRRGTVTVTGEVTNTTEDTWTDLQAYLMTSAGPIGTEADPGVTVRGRLHGRRMLGDIGANPLGSSAHDA